MLRSCDWLASLMLRVPESIRSFRKVPVLGGLLQKLSYRVLQQASGSSLILAAGTTTGRRKRENLPSRRVGTTPAR